MEEYVSQLEETGDYNVIDYNSIGEYYATSNDTHRSDQWYLASINAYTAWDITMGASNITVAVLDSGTDWMHPDIGIGNDSYQNIFLNPNEDIWQDVNAPQTGNRLDDDGNGFVDDWKGWNFVTNNNDVRTTNGHGTRVAGIVGAKSNNRIGIAGIVGGNRNGGAKIMPICVGIDAPDGAILDDAIVYAVNNGARVIQLSLGIGETQAINDAIAFAIAENVVIVCASGNGYSSTVNFPASHPNIIAVGATNRDNVRADFSNYGTNFDVIAPGVDIFSTTLNNEYNSENGTSFAAPQVSGIAALILSVRPDLRQDQVRHAIESTCTKLSSYSFSNNATHPNGTWNNQVGHGLVNAYAAVNLVAPKISGPDYVCRGSTATFTVSNAPANYTWSCSRNLEAVPGSPGTFTVTSSLVFVRQTWVGIEVDGVEVARKSITVGIPAGSISAPYDLDCHCQVGTVYTNTSYMFYAEDIPSGLSPADIAWEVIYPNSIRIPMYAGYNPVITFTEAGNCILRMYLTESCGNNDYAYKNLHVINRGPIIWSYPNPASNILNIEIDQEAPAQANQTNAKQPKTGLTYDIRLYDYQGNLLRQKFTKGGKVEFNVANLTTGIYYLHIYDGVNEKPEMRQIVVEH